MADERKKLLTFDPTIHAGHIITALTIVASALGVWFGTMNTVSSHTSELRQHREELKQHADRMTAERERTDRKFDTLVQDNNHALSKLRDDMQGWFMTLNDKLDRKADKR